MEGIQDFTREINEIAQGILNFGRVITLYILHEIESFFIRCKNKDESVPASKIADTQPPLYKEQQSCKFCAFGVSLSQWKNKISMFSMWKVKVY
jgi:hypothetical protein